jgi:type II secretory pathway component PulL
MVVHVGAQAYDLVRLHLEESRIDSAIAETFAVAMPGAEKMVDPRRQMQQRLGGAGGLDPAGLLGRLDGLSQAFAAVPGLRVESMSWRDRRLDMRVSAPSGDALSELSRAAVQRGLTFDVQSTVPREGGVEGVVSIAAGGQP